MRETVVQNLIKRFDSYAELIGIDVNISEKLDAPKHKSLGEHLWCVVGARESYAKALRAGEWDGFSCSMTEFSQPDFIEKLQTSAEDVKDAIKQIDDWTRNRELLLLELSDHEVMHEGQIIRHLYGLGHEIPASVKWA
jgi:hypothetical protein